MEATTKGKCPIGPRWKRLSFSENQKMSFVGIEMTLRAALTAAGIKTHSFTLFRKVNGMNARISDGMTYLTEVRIARQIE